ncbi:pyridoxamine 5'-phosphate oxidase family protein [Candidatus Colwellia aromaticivorans]|uniref:pyridoxamine 5'-phosphate oxidase family protein n=1 Tax=Candidatus Colwellia aromaticivorans TaxID=2267621 RepID=UPI000DF24885|nr:pyridoxamine 5'-phosphate oxidase family protein [Candidatus Colwellia aromaticivorans]
MTQTNQSQFHLAEIAVQERLGIAESVAHYSEGLIRAVMPEQHRKFYSELPFVVLGVTDSKGYPWPIPLFGRAGFIQSTNDTTLQFRGLPRLIKTLALEFITGQKIGMLGIQLSTRRRNRVNGVIQTISGESFSIQVEQSFGNCPKYIQKRELIWASHSQSLPHSLDEKLVTAIDANAIALIEEADTFFIASRTKYFDKDKRSGIDASHRGGKPGFVKVENNRLKFPDFKGNGFFNTLGNIESDSRVGLFFPDFSTGNAVFVAGQAHVLWDEEARAGFNGAERIVEVNIEQSVYLPAFMEMTAELKEFSPVLQGTSIW